MTFVTSIVSGGQVYLVEEVGRKHGMIQTLKLCEVGTLYQQVSPAKQQLLRTIYDNLSKIWAKSAYILKGYSNLKLLLNWGDLVEGEVVSIYSNSSV